ncbi:hypothetical protein [Neisseria meningitidis]|uniref:hypothetical protein n=1 Tax=Neisseria meningitidis TaxID=487 RepID=UPI000AE812AF|nr:hypothetical protein [Neisseria meningitidis]
MNLQKFSIVAKAEKGFYSGLTKIRTNDEAADSTNSTETIHLFLQHLRESFLLAKARQHHTGFCESTIVILILWVSKPGGAETLQKCRLKLEIGFRRHWFMRQVGA